MFKTFMRILVGMTGALVIVAMFLPDILIRFFGVELISLVPLWIFVLSSPFLGIAALAVYRPRDSPTRAVLMYALVLPTLAVLAYLLFNYWRPGQPPVFIQQLTVYDIIAGAGSLVATALRSDWNYRPPARIPEPYAED